jgi:tetratricopeptide (TPR) repeat protein
MSDPHRDPYEVLRVPRDADARTVKAAYFALVREFPPETHPAEFQELRDAYETLSDPERREALDASRDAFAELGAEQAALLRAAHDCFAQDDVAGGVAMLRRVIADHPDLLVAREQLGLAFLRARAFDDAAKVWGELVVREPANARYHLHLGYAHHGAERPRVAADCFRRALEGGAGDEARLALAEVLSDAGEWREAVRVLDEGIAAAAAPPPPLVRKKVGVLLLHGRARQAWQAFDHLALALAGHEQERAAHAEELASLAAWLFARNRQRLANQLLRRLAVLDPGRKPDRVFPARATVHTADLPPESLDWLAGKVERPRRIVQAERSRATALLALVPGAVLLWWTVARVTGAAPWSSEDRLWTAVLCALASAALAFGGRRFHAALTSSLGRMNLVHPAYFLKLDYDLLHLFPLVNLHDVKVVQHGTNGVYTHTVVHLPFGARALRLSFRSHSEATSFAEALLDRRRRMLELQANGLVETEPGIDLVPAALLAGGAGRRPRWAFLAGGAALAAALGFGAAVLLHARAVDAREWGEARDAGTPAALRDYLARHPGQEARVRAALDTWLEEVASSPSGGLVPGPGRERGQAILRAMADGAPRELLLQLRWAVPPADGACAFSCPLLAENAEDLGAVLQVAFERTLGPNVVLVEGQGQGQQIVIEVSVSAGAPRTYRASGASLPALCTPALDYALRLLPAGGPPLEARGTAPLPTLLDIPAGEPPPRTPAVRPAPVASTTRQPIRLPMPASPEEFLRLSKLHPQLRLRPGTGGKIEIEIPGGAEPEPVPVAATPPPPGTERSPADACRALAAAQRAALRVQLARELGLVSPQEVQP